MPVYNYRRRRAHSSYGRSRRYRLYPSYGNSSRSYSRYSSSSSSRYSSSSYISYGPSRRYSTSYSRDYNSLLADLREKLNEWKKEQEEREKREKKRKEKLEKEKKERERREVERARREREKKEEEEERRVREEKEKEAKEAAERARRQREKMEKELRLRREREERERKEEEERLKKEREEKERLEREARERAERERAERANKRPVEVTDVDLHIEENAKEHHTDKYDVTEKDEDPEPVLRRGQSFLMDITFDRPYKNEHHELRIVFKIGETGNGEQHIIKLNENGEKPKATNKWHARLTGNKNNTICTEVFVPCNCIIGEWALCIDTRIQGSGDKYDRYEHPVDINIILNPWCKDDTVYQESELDKLNEYVLNEKGAVFKGNKTSQYPSPWSYNQFGLGILEICFEILRKGNKQQYSKALGDPVKIARQLSYLINDIVLMGNWSGDYSDGVRPTHWNGSDAILKQYGQTGQKVKYGQCWVFSAVTVTVCRALGIPCKSVTCIGSAHDTDESTTIDEYYVEDGKNLTKSRSFTSDSVWNFHVWNEVLLKRTDNHDGECDGWNVIDATPQELSNEDLLRNHYACGPASVDAIKKGNCSRGFDSKFIFAEVNADVSKWKQENGLTWEIFGVDTNRQVKLHWTFDFNKRNDIDLLHTCYAKAVMKAGLASNIYRSRGYLDRKKPENYSIRLRDNEDEKVLMGQGFTLFFDCENNTDRTITLDNVSITLSLQTYTGDLFAKYLVKDFKGTQISANAVKTLEVPVKAEQYVKHLTKDGAGDNDLDGDMEASVIAQSSDGALVVIEQFRIGWPDLEIEAPKKVIAGQEFQVKVSFTEDMPMALTKCKLNWEGAGFESVENVDIGNINQKKGWSHTIKVKAKKTKKEIERELIVSLDCKELPDMNGTADINILVK